MRQWHPLQLEMIIYSSLAGPFIILKLLSCAFLSLFFQQKDVEMKAGSDSQ
jgi:hypothetical protein